MEKRCIQRMVRKPEVSGHLGDPGVDGRIIPKWVFRKWDVWHGLNRSAAGEGEVASTCECGKIPPCSIKFWELLD
jgi:hypothetical protein